MTAARAGYLGQKRKQKLGKRKLTVLLLASFALPACARIVRNPNLPGPTRPGAIRLPEPQLSEKNPFGVMFYTGSPEQYAAELKAACEVAHQKNIPCANGGPVSLEIALLVYEHYLESGETASAEDFATRAFTPEERHLLSSPKAKDQIGKGKALLSSYRAAGADYVNFHWCIADTRALGEAVTYLKAQTGLPVITNEIGQHHDNPDQTRAVMGKVVELRLPIAVWFSVDAPKARALVKKDGRLRPTGEAFQQFIGSLSAK